jgi:glycosyltransferase involved in cell wall biosynthesis
MQTKMQNLLVSIPFCNSSNCVYFQKAIDSILNQTRLPDKILLVKDGPVNPNLLKIVERFCKEHSNLTILDLPINKGLPFALNRSIDLSFKYYARMDSDDICDPYRFEKQVQFLDNNIDIDVLGTWAIEFVSDNNTEEFLKKMPASIINIKKMFHYRDPFVHPSVMFRTCVFEKIGFYNEKYFTNQDTELWARALKSKVGMANLQEPLIHFRADNLTNKRSVFKRITLEVQARYTFNTLSPVLNILKIASILFRFIPLHIQKLAYKFLR